MNKTQKANDGATESAHKKKSNKLLAFFVVIAGIFAVGGMYYRSLTDCSLYTSKIDAMANCIELELAKTKDQQVKGLSSRDGMKASKGMLFVFDVAGEYCMWMKDMRFNIDIVWLDQDKRITHIEQNLSPDTYPKIYCGGDQDKYVVEVNSGIVDKLKLDIGKRVKLND